MIEFICNAPLEDVLSYINTCTVEDLMDFDDLIFNNLGAIEDSREAFIIKEIAKNRGRIEDYWIEKNKEFYNQ